MAEPWKPAGLGWRLGQLRQTLPAPPRGEPPVGLGLPLPPLPLPSVPPLPPLPLPSVVSAAPVVCLLVWLAFAAHTWRCGR